MDAGPDTTRCSLALLVSSSLIKILASLTPYPVTALKSTNSLSSTFAPTRNPCVKIGGFTSLSVNPKRYNLLLFATDVVIPTSNACQSIFSCSLVIALGAIRLVTNALLSFANASFLNPAEVNDN